MNVVQINIGFSEIWINLIIGDLVVTNFELAINIVKASKIRSVQLKLENKNSVSEWDNF